MKIVCIRHISFEKVGAIEVWAKNNGHFLKEIKTYSGQNLPELEDFDFLIVMGGPQSAIDINKYSYLREEVELIKKAINGKKLVLGICLGAQLISKALGAEVKISLEKEIGIYPISLTSEGKNSILFKDFPNSFPAIHWHGDTFCLPKESKLLASSLGCENQAYSYKDNVYALQFHLEVTKSILKDLIEHCHEDLKQPGKYIQDSKKIIDSDIDSINTMMHSLLNNIVNSHTEKK